MHPLIITASICGREKNKSDSPYFPAYKDEVVADGIKSYKHAAPQLHIHARGDDGLFTYDAKVFGEILSSLRSQCPDAILQISTGGTYNKPAELLEPLLGLHPDMATFAVQPDTAANIHLLATFENYGVKPIVECFSLDHAETAINLFKDGYIKAPMNLEFLYDDHRNDIPFATAAEQLLKFSKMCEPYDINWSVCKALGNDPGIHAMAIALGGNCRVGLEDRLTYSDGSYVKESAELVEQIKCAAGLQGRALANCREARNILGINDAEQ